MEVNLNTLSLAEKTALLKALSLDVRDAKSVVRVNENGNVVVPVSNGKYGSVGMSPTRLLKFLSALGYVPNDAVNALVRDGDAIKARIAADGVNGSARDADGDV